MTHDYKRDFPIFQHTDVAYIDNAATAQRPQCVLDAVADFYRWHNANPLRGLYPLSVEATDIYERYPAMNEGELSQLKIALVSGNMLSMIAEGLGVGPLIAMPAAKQTTGTA